MGSPYFLLRGRNWRLDIPALVEEAAARHPGVTYLVAAPFGLHPLMAEVVDPRVEHCLGPPAARRPSARRARARDAAG